MKKKLLRIFLFIMTLLSCIVPSEMNGPNVRKVDAYTFKGYVLFEKPSTWTNAMFLIGHNSWSVGYKMTNITGTNIYYYNQSGNWDNATVFAFADASGSWSGSSEQIYSRVNGIKNYIVYENTYKLGTNNYFFSTEPNFTSNYGAYSSFNTTLNVEASNGGTVSAKGYKLTSLTAAAENNGTSISIIKNTNATLTATSTNGYLFDGWYNSSTSTTKLSSNATYTVENITTSSTYYARFNPISYNIKFDGNGKTSGSMTELPVTYDSPFTLTKNSFEKTGHTFIGWNTEANGQGTSFSDEATISTNLSSTNGETVTLYAQWKINTYNIEFEPGSGVTGTQDTIVKTYGIAVQLPGPVYSKIGYTQTQWKTKSSDTYYELNGTYTNNSETTLIPIFEANTYTISFVTDTDLPVPDQINIVYDTPIGELPTPKTPGEEYVFLGWYLDSKAEDNDKINNDIILNSENFNITNNNSREITLYARYKELQKFTITFDSNGGSPVNSIQVFQTLNYGFITSLPTPTRDGYTFAGWKYGDTLVLNESKLEVEGHHQLVASWTANPYTVTLNQEHATTPSNTTSVTATFDSIMPSLASLPTRTGYIFEGYYSQSGGTGTKYYNADGTSARTWNISSNSTLYPKWAPNKYSVEYNANGGTGTIANSECTYDQTFNLPNNTFTRVGYNFAGWNTKADGTGTSYTNEASVKNLTSVNNGTTTLYAQWTPITYTIILDSNNESGNTKIVTATYDSPTTLPLDSFSQPGYEIVGWSTTYNGDKICTDTLAANQNLSSTQGAEVTLYAIWDIKTYNITYSYADELNDVSHNNPKGYTILSDSITLTEPTRENYTFAGWTCTYLGVTEPTKNLVIPKGTYGDLTITANWDQKVTFYIDMGIIYEQFPITTHSIDNPIIHLWQNGGRDFDSYGDLKLNRVGDTTIYTIDIYFTKNNVIHKNIDAKSVEYIDMIMFGYDETLWSTGAVTHKNTETLNLHLDGTNNGDEYVLKIENNKIVWGEWEVGKTYHIYNITHLYSWNDQSNKWFSCSYYESLEPSAAGTITFIVHYDWSGIGDMYIGGIKATKNSTAKTYTSVVTTAKNLTGFEINFEQNGAWYHVDEDGDVNTQSNNTSSKLAHSHISSITLIDAPRVNYYDGNNLVHTSSYIESNQVHFIEKEGYKLEGWYTTPTFDEGTKFEKEYDIVGSINIYANYVVAHDYFIYVEAKNIGWDMENMSVYKWSDYFSNHNNSWPGSKDDIVYLGNGIYRVHIDASKSFDYLIFCDTNTKNANKVASDIVQTQDIVMTPTMSYYVISSNTVLGSSGESKGKYLNKISYEKSLENDIYAQKNSSNSNINEFRFTSGLEAYDDLIEIPQDTVGKEFGYKFIFINGDECYVGYWNFTTNTMLDCVRYEGTLYEASNEGYKGYYSLTLTDDINFKYSNYNQIIVVACYRDNTGNTQIIKAQEYNIVGTGTNVQLYKIER